jgi:hypothetical protein
MRIYIARNRKGHSLIRIQRTQPAIRFVTNPGVGAACALKLRLNLRRC